MHTYVCVQKTGIEVSKAAWLTLLFYQAYCVADIYVAISFNISADYIKIKFIFCNKYLYFILFLLKKNVIFIYGKYTYILWILF